MSRDVPPAPSSERCPSRSGHTAPRRAAPSPSPPHLPPVAVALPPGLSVGRRPGDPALDRAPPPSPLPSCRTVSFPLLYPRTPAFSRVTSSPSPARRAASSPSPTVVFPFAGPSREASPVAVTLRCASRTGMPPSVVALREDELDGIRASRNVLQERGGRERSTSSRRRREAREPRGSDRAAVSVHRRHPRRRRGAGGAGSSIATVERGRSAGRPPGDGGALL